MNERDDELLKRYRELPREAPPPALDASILARSRRAARRPLARWAAPFSVAAVLVLALGLVLKVQREAPEATLPSTQEQAMPGTAAAPPAAASAGASTHAAPEDGAKPKDAQAPAAVRERPVVQPPKLEKKQPPEPKRASPFTPEPAAPASPSTADLAPATAPPAPVSRAQSARMAAAPAAAAAKEAATPEQRELERIARLRADGKDDEADAALEAFRRAHPDYRIEPAMWEKVRRH